jgi:hypothetical protein
MQLFCKFYKTGVVVCCLFALVILIAIVARFTQSVARDIQHTCIRPQAQGNWTFEDLFLAHLNRWEVFPDDVVVVMQRISDKIHSSMVTFDNPGSICDMAATYLLVVPPGETLERLEALHPDIYTYIQTDCIGEPLDYVLPGCRFATLKEAETAAESCFKVARVLAYVATFSTLILAAISFIMAIVESSYH